MNKSSALSGQLMAVKTLKIIFRKFFRTLTNHKLIILNYKSASDDSTLFRTTVTKFGLAGGFIL